MVRTWAVWQVDATQLLSKTKHSYQIDVFITIPHSFVKNAEKHEVVIARHEFAVFRGALQSVIHHNRKAPDVKSAIKQPAWTLKDIAIAHSHNNITRQLIEQLPTNTLS